MYTDKELRDLTQIAYMDFSKSYEVISGKNSPGRVTDTSPQYLMDLIEADPGSAEKLDMSVIDAHPDWKIITPYDTNDTNGFYACLVETEPGHLVIAFRGSESLTNAKQRGLDWVDADLGLLGAWETEQQAEVRRMFENPEIRDILSRYDHISMTGHSLGGNLAEYATIASVDYGFDYKVDQCVSFDGPGFSDEYIEGHREQIDKVNGKMTHYQWSVVGMLLNMIPGVNYQHVAVNNWYIPLLRHSTEGLMYDKNGNLVPGIMSTGWDIFALGGKEVSLILDKYFAGENAGRNLMDLALKLVVLGPAGALWGNVIQNTGKIVYNKLVNWFKTITHRDADFFRVDTAALDRDVGTACACINKVRGNVDEMFSAVQGLNGMWTGAANKAFTEKFMKEKADIDNFLEEIERHVRRLERESAEYNRCEQRAVSMASSVN